MLEKKSPSFSLPGPHLKRCLTDYIFTQRTDRNFYPGKSLQNITAQNIYSTEYIQHRIYTAQNIYSTEYIQHRIYTAQNIWVQFESFGREMLMDFLKIQYRIISSCLETRQDKN